MSPATIFGRIIESDHGDLTPELAEHILTLDFGDEDRDRMNQLAAKAREDTLSANERVELESFNLLGDLLAIWQSKARKSLAQASTAP